MVIGNFSKHASFKTRKGEINQKSAKRTVITDKKKVLITGGFTNEIMKLVFVTIFSNHSCINHTLQLGKHKHICLFFYYFFLTNLSLYH